MQSKYDLWQVQNNKQAVEKLLKNVKVIFEVA
jgi:plasmid maintenance system antidote protein VapI